MREVKFRALIAGEMREFDLYDIYGGEFDDGYKIPVNVMQYTGLKDTNRVEIYEGDIVNHNGIGIGFISYNDKHAAYKIVFKGTTRKWLIDMLEREMRELEVIGNIYENPELLEEAK
jgi:uncharacterized phage protein (TIGR01671 family)